MTREIIHHGAWGTYWDTTTNVAYHNARRTIGVVQAALEARVDVGRFGDRWVWYIAEETRDSPYPGYSDAAVRGTAATKREAKKCLAQAWADLDS